MNKYKLILNNNRLEIKKNRKQKKIKKEEISKDYRFAVLSTMSSGKSTLINALLGKDILPSENQACTGKIFEISNFKIENEIIQALKNEEVVFSEIDKDKLGELNNNNEIDKIKIGVKFYGINKEIVLYDTPGVNNYMNKNHEEVTYNFLEKNEIKNIIYILNATQIGVNDDKKFLLDLKEFYKNQEINIIFLLNKMDTVDLEYENKNLILENTRDYLKNLGFENSILIPTSAQIAKILRKGINNNLETRRERLEFKNHIDMYLEKNNISINKKTIGKKMIEKMISETGIKELEAIISKK
ncbi:MAG: dynamin family protein [Cetobacterium somerae]|uniref:dynamin family protein n=1 Tax=Cetobacterium somerae TaxID=188913 RepID=UPI003F3239CD